MNHTFVTTISSEIAQKLKTELEESGFEIKNPPYTLFSAQKNGISVVFYTSGRLVVQGKNKDDFIKYYLEPEILKSFDYSYSELQIDTTPRIGVDESGKGDFFGPLCVAALYADCNGINKLHKIGVKDSKKLSDPTIKKLAYELKNSFTYKSIIISPRKYNELYENFKNLNYLLAWGHATVIEALSKETKCKKAIIDKFANECVVASAIKNKGLDIDLTQIHGGERDLVVAGASILARNDFLDGLDSMKFKYNFTFPKGASQAVIDAGNKFAKQFSKDELINVSKVHFKTTNELSGN